MPTTFRPYQPDQIPLLAPDLRDWVAQGHLAHHISDLVDSLDLSAFCAPYEGDGRRSTRTRARGDAPHGREAGDRARAGAIREAQVVIGGAQRLGQGGARVPTLQPSGPGQGTGRMGLGVPGAQYQANRGTGGLLREALAGPSSRWAWERAMITDEIPTDCPPSASAPIDVSKRQATPAPGLGSKRRLCNRPVQSKKSCGAHS